MLHQEVIEEIMAKPEGEIPESKLADLWAKIRPMMGLLGTIFGRKVRPYIKAFIAAIDAVVEKEDVDTISI